MTKYEFLHKLMDGLKDINATDRRDILNDYEDHFRNGEQDGRDEFDLVKGLGDPDELATEILGNYGIKKEPEKKENRNDDNNNREQSDLKIKQNFKCENVKLIKANVFTDDVEVIVEDRYDIVINYWNRGNSFYLFYGPPTISYENGEISIKARSLEGKHFFSRASKLKGKLTINIPKQYSERIRIKTVNGMVSVKDAKVYELSVSTVSGNVNLTDIKAKNLLDLNSISGKLNATGEADILQIKNTSGKIMLDGKFSKVSINTISGIIALRHNDTDIDASINSVSGRAVIELPETADFKTVFSSFSGKLNSEFPVNPLGENHSSENIIKTNTVSGNLVIKKI